MESPPVRVPSYPISSVFCVPSSRPSLQVILFNFELKLQGHEEDPGTGSDGKGETRDQGIEILFHQVGHF